MGAWKRASRFLESPDRHERVPLAPLWLLAFVVFSAGACTAAGEFEPKRFTGASGSGARTPSAPGQATARGPMSLAPVLGAGEAASPASLFPQDIANDNAGDTRSGGDAAGIVRDAGHAASDAGDGGAAGSSDGGSVGDAGTQPNGSDASTPQDGGGALDASTPLPRAPCPGLVFEGGCYEFFDEQLSWSDAEARCAGWGGHLASVESSEEDAFIGAWPALMGVTFLDGSGLWLGGTDALGDGDFRWSDDRALAFVGWAPDQPNNGAGVDCIEKRNDNTQRWYDRRCSDVERYVCERPD